jgi:hypothetical protein
MITKGCVGSLPTLTKANRAALPPQYIKRQKMVYSVVRSFQAALKYRGGWRGLLEHIMYTVSAF